MTRPESILVAVGSGSEDLLPTLVERMRQIRPDAPLYVVSEFQVEGASWVPYHVGRTWRQNLALCRAAFAGKRILFAGLILQPRMPYWGMRLVALLLGRLNTIFFNENLDHYMLRPRSLPVIARHLAWRAGNLLRWELRPGGATYTFLWRLLHPAAFLRPLLCGAARLAGWYGAWIRRMSRGRVDRSRPVCSAPAGISVVIPSRDGRELLQRLLPGLIRETAPFPSEIIVVDNGSSDGTREWLASEYPAVIAECVSEPLSFSRATNLGIARARYDRVLMLNNDMVLEPGFFPPLLDAFSRVPDLFCATAQILFPAGERRQETGKAVMPPKRPADAFPVACLEPVEGENLSYVLYGSGGCSLFDAARLRHLGGLKEIYQPAYVEDLDLGFRAWQRGWPTVFVAAARVEHRHRSTTSRYYSQRELDALVEVNYLKFLASTVASGDVFASLWRQAVTRLNIRAATMTPDPAAMAALRRAPSLPLSPPTEPAPAMDERAILAIGSGDVAVFPGAAAQAGPPVFIVSPYVPFPLSHGGAVRMYNLMREAARDYTLVLVCFADELVTPPREIRTVCAEVALVRRHGSHRRPLTARPDTVEEFDVPAMHAALRLLAAKWKPRLAQLEFTQMAQYAPSCAGAATILVEHDITLDLYRQLLARGEDWETRQQYERWVNFERQAWRDVDAVVVMSEKDRREVDSGNAAVIANGVDLARFCVSGEAPEPNRVLFIGSFAHLPNVLALDWFLREVWPAVRQAAPSAVFHVIAGQRHEFFLERYRGQASPDLAQPGVELEGFVPDPRPAYRRAAVVVAPLLASAGTNIKIMEAMAMGRAIVSTPAGINGLDDLQPGADVVVTRTAAAMASAILDLLSNPERRSALERRARSTVEARYGWDAIGRQQKRLYDRLLAGAGRVAPAEEGDARL